jgi:thiol-disulfide isomerase/thioredoxin
MRKRIIIDFLCVVFVGLLAYIGIYKLMDYKASVLPEPEETGNEGMLLPSFKLLLPDSTTIFDTKDIPEGQPVVLFYFSPRCPYCHEQIEEIRRSYERLKDIRIYAVTPYPFPEMKIFYERFQLEKSRNVVVGVDSSFFFGRYFKTNGVPYIAIYGKDKRLKGAFLGNLSNQQITAVAEK